MANQVWLACENSDGIFEIRIGSIEQVQSLTGSERISVLESLDGKEMCRRIIEIFSIAVEEKIYGLNEQSAITVEIR